MRRTALAVVLLLALAVCAQAQSANQQVVGIETGVVYGYNLDPANQGLGIGQEIAISLTVADGLQAGFSYVQGDGANLPDLTVLRLSYVAVGPAGVTVSAGTNGTPNPVAGIGIFSDLLGNTFQGSLFTALGIRVEYLFDTTVGIEDGLLTFSLGAKVGI